MKELRLLVCSDIHGSERALKTLSDAAGSDQYDAVIACGDFTTMGSTDFVRKFLGSFEQKVLAVPGNCDFPDTVSVLEASGASIHNMSRELKGWKVFGFGGGLPGSSGTPFEVEEDIMERSLRAIAIKDGIMVTHTPAYGMNDHGKFGGHAGSKGILRVAQEFSPVLALSGHIHEARGKVLTKDTTFVNPGPARNGCYASIVVGETVEVEFHEQK
ncbi:MAG: metallophosphoesterase family protein [Thermoplasmata archaeon]|nr:metallophosphoesterase family protein [Thermoplasmata archaeon]